MKPKQLIRLKAKAMLLCSAVLIAPAVLGSALTLEEINQIESEFGITLTDTEKANLAADAKLDAPLPQWRIDAKARIETYRKADLDVQVVDSEGNPVPDAQVAIKLTSNAFKFGGIFSARDFEGSRLPSTITRETYRARLLSMFNAGGVNNAFKPKVEGGHKYLPEILNWARANNMPIRGHLLLWPGRGSAATLDDPDAVSGKNYGDHLSYDVLSAVDTYRYSDRTQADEVPA